MSRKIFNNNQIYSRSSDKDLYFEKNNVIFDKTCPNCKKLLIEDGDFCDCGYFLKSTKNSIFLTTIISIWLTIGVIITIILLNIDKIDKFSIEDYKNHNVNFDSLAPVNIQIISKLKNTPYSEHIQSIYVKPKEKNKLVILIKPTVWNILTDKEKQELRNLVEDNWKIIYKQNNSDPTKKPEVSFANSE